MVAIAVVTLVVFVGGLLAAYVDGTAGGRRGVKLAVSPTTVPFVPSLSSSATTTLPPPPDPVVPAGFTLHCDEAHGYAVAIPDGWIVIDLAAAPSVDAAFAAVRQDHPDRAKSLENLRTTVTDELLVAVGPLNGALITDLVVSKRPPLHGITSPAFMDSYERALRDTASKTAEPTDMTIYAATIASRPAIRASFHFTQTLTSGATDEAFRYIAIVEGNRSDYALWMNTDTPDESSPIFEQAAGTLTPLG